MLQVFDQSLIDEGLITVELSGWQCNSLHVLAEKGAYRLFDQILEELQTRPSPERVTAIECTNSSGATPMWVTVRNGNYHILESLATSGANFHTRDDLQRTLRHAACLGVPAESVLLFLAKSHLDLETRDSQNQTPLYLAVKSRSLQVVGNLLSFGADIEARSNDNDEPVLLTAAGVGDASIVQLLLIKGARLEATDSGGKTALYVAAQQGHEMIAQALMNHGAHVEGSTDDGNAALQVAIRNGYETVVHALLKRGADIEATDSPVDKTLLAAASHDRPETILALCDAGANVGGKDCHGRMVLYRVPRCGLSWAVEKLLERGFRCDVQDDCGETSLHNAMFQADHRTAKKLIEWKAPILWANERLLSPFNLASDDHREDAADHTLRTREQDMVQPPLDHGSKLEARDTRVGDRCTKL